MSDFVIENGVLKEYNGPGGDAVVPDGVTSIGDRAFKGCTSITTITLPEGVTSIGDDAFWYCKSLTSITLPDGVTSIGDDAFWGCRGLTLNVSRWLPYYTTLYKSDGFPYVRPNVITIVPPNLRRLALLGFVSEEIGDPSSERSKSYLNYAKRNAGKLCSAAFDNPKLLQYLCDNKLINPGDVDVYIEEAQKRGNVEHEALILNYQKSLGMKNVFRARVEKEKKKEEYEEAFIERMMKRDPSQGIAGMTFVVTGELGHWKSRKNLKEYLEKHGAKLGSSVTKKTDYLVTNNTDSSSEKKRKAAELGVEIITEEKFNNMVGKRYTDAERIEIPGWIKEIPTDAFKYCKVLKEVVLPEGLTSIGDGTFFSRESLTSITIPESVTSIGDWAFYDCKNLTIRAPAGSYAEEYAKNNGIPFAAT